MEYLEKLKNDVVNKANLNDFPEEITEDTQLWVRAIALVKKQDGNLAYSILQRTPAMNWTYTYTNGSTSMVQKVEKIYPYELLNRKYVKGFRGNAIEPRVEYLKSLNILADSAVENMSLSELNKAIVGAAVYLQLNNK